MNKKQEVEVNIYIKDWFSADSLPVLARAANSADADIMIIDLHYRRELSEQMMAGIAGMATSVDPELIKDPFDDYFRANSMVSKYDYIYDYLPRSIDKLEVVLNIPFYNIGKFADFIEGEDSLTKLHKLIVKSLK